MIIPIRCFTCGKILGDKWNYYQKELEKAKGSKEDTVIDVHSSTIKPTPEGIILDKLEITKYCCRRIMLGTVEILPLL